MSKFVTPETLFSELGNLTEGLGFCLGVLIDSKPRTAQEADAALKSLMDTLKQRAGRGGLHDGGAFAVAQELRRGLQAHVADVS